MYWTYSRNIGAVRPRIPRGRQSSRIVDFQFDGLFDLVDDVRLEFRSPEFGVFFFDAVDQVDAEVEVDRLIAQDVLELLADACHFVLAVEGEDHDKAAIEEDPFHDDVVADQVF